MMTATTKTNVWRYYADMTEIDFEGSALSTLKLAEGYAVVRKTKTGEFAVILASGPKGKVVKVFPTLDRARAYSFAIERNSR